MDKNERLISTDRQQKCICDLCKHRIGIGVAYVVKTSFPYGRTKRRLEHARCYYLYVGEFDELKQLMRDGCQ